MVTHYGNSACEGSYQLKMAAPAEVNKKHSNFRIRQFYEKRHFNIAANPTLNTMVSFIILLIARTARIACPDRQTDRQTDRQNDKPSTVTLAAHANNSHKALPGRTHTQSLQLAHEESTQVRTLSNSELTRLTRDKSITNSCIKTNL